MSEFGIRKYASLFSLFLQLFFRRYQLYNWKLQVYMYNITKSLIFVWHLTVSNNLLLFFFSDDMVGFLKRKENTLIKIRLFFFTRSMAKTSYLDIFWVLFFKSYDKSFVPLHEHYRKNVTFAVILNIRETF